jgi:WD40 repeat-containing protein SMU1
LELLGRGLKTTRESSKGLSNSTYNMLEDEFVPFEDLADQPPNQLLKTVRLPSTSRPMCLCYTQNGQYLILGMSDGFIEVWNPISASLATDIAYQNDEVFMMHSKEITALFPSKDSLFLASADIGKTVNIWNISTGSILRSFENSHTGTVNCIVFTPEEDQIVTASNDIKVSTP